MLPDDTRGKIENITEGVILKGQEDNCTALRNFLCRRFTSGGPVKKNFEGNALIKKEQEILIESFCNDHHLAITELPSHYKYLTHGGEAKIYYSEEEVCVIKLNDGVYYATWLEFLNSVLLHNLFFENTSYQLLGFKKDGDHLYAVLKQPFIPSDKLAELDDIRKFLEFNGFIHVIRQDYRHPEFGLILEDMHDENVLVNSDTLFFIDTVFYINK